MSEQEPKSEQEPTTTREEAEIEDLPSGSPTLYINQSNVIHSQWDFKIYLSDVSTDPLTKKTVVQRKVRIAMSPQHMKAFALVALANVAKFEKKYGTIKAASANPSLDPQKLIEIGQKVIEKATELQRLQKKDDTAM